MKPRLPQDIVQLFPKETIGLIYSYVPHYEKEEVKEVSPSFEREVKRIQNMKLKGRDAMYLYDFDDFILD